MLPHILHIILYLKGFQDEPSDELDPHLNNTRELLGQTWHKIEELSIP